MISDTLLRHLKTHRTRHRRQGPPQTRSHVDNENDHPQTLAGDVTLQDPDTGVGAKHPPGDPDLGPKDATLGLTLDPRPQECTMAPPTFDQTQTRVTDSHAAIVSPEQTIRDQTSDQSLLFQFGSSTTAGQDAGFPAYETTVGYQSLVDNPLFSDNFMHFDATNWLLDEHLVDFGLGDLMWNEPLYGNDGSNMRPQSSVMSKGRNDIPTVIDMRKMWYNHPRRTLDTFNVRDEAMAPHGNTTTGKDIDETYRNHMNDELSPPSRDEPLPSIDFLVITCLPSRLSFTSNPDHRISVSTYSSPASTLACPWYMHQLLDQAKITFSWSLPCAVLAPPPCHQMWLLVWGL